MTVWDFLEKYIPNYCAKGFAQQAKLYLPENAGKATDIIATQKLAELAGTSVYTFFVREYLPELQKNDRTYLMILSRLREIAQDGLFFPILMNEIEKYAAKVFPAPVPAPSKVIEHFIDFVHTIATRQQGERVSLTFCEDQIKIRIILAVSDDDLINIDRIVDDVSASVQEHRFHTIYVLASGRKVEFADEIAEKIYQRNIQDIYEPVYSTYKRYTRKPGGTDSVCYEINL